MATCGTVGCPGHLGKFDSCLTEALYEITLDGGSPDDFGNVEFEGYFSFITFGHDDTHEIGSSVDDPSGVIVPIPAGAYVVTSTSSGAVYSERYDTMTEALDFYVAARCRYEEWDES